MPSLRFVPAGLLVLAALTFAFPFITISSLGATQEIGGLQMIFLAGEFGVLSMLLGMILSVLVVGALVGAISGRAARIAPLLAGGVAALGLALFIMAASAAAESRNLLLSIQLSSGPWFALIVSGIGAAAAMVMPSVSRGIIPISDRLDPAGSEVEPAPIVLASRDAFEVVRSVTVAPASRSVIPLPEERDRRASMAILGALVMVGAVATGIGHEAPWDAGMFAVIAFILVSGAGIYVLAQIWKPAEEQTLLHVLGVVLAPLAPAFIVAGIVGFLHPVLFAAAVIGGAALSTMALRAVLLREFPVTGPLAAIGSAIVVGAGLLAGGLIVF